jgi:tetratricopeptide (TPR) repeat protein
MRKILGTLIIGLLLTASGGNVNADRLEDGIAAYQRGDFATALRLFQPLAEQGDASAQSNLGVMYEQGRGVAQNYREAMRWFRLAAMQGDASAQSNLGVMYFKGQGIAQDFREAMKWYRLEHFSIRLGVPRVCEISFAFLFGNTFEKKGDCPPKFLNCARLHFA